MIPGTRGPKLRSELLSKWEPQGHSAGSDLLWMLLLNKLSEVYKEEALGIVFSNVVCFLCVASP